ncbi:hypothetical protein HYO11_18720 [Vibrio parahaemolyticus]|nr:hypothetical protein [Vibrio parahaemolyticus]
MVKTIIQFFKNDLKTTTTTLFYTILIALMFFYSNNAKAYSKDDYVVSYYYQYNHLLSYADILKSHSGLINNVSVSHFDSTSSGYHIITNIEEGTSASDTAFYYNSSTGYRSFRNYENNYYTIQDCEDAGYGILQIPSGFTYEGQYICVPTDLGGEEIEEPPVYYTPEEFDNWFCGQEQIKDKLSFAYYPLENAIDYRVRRSLTSANLSNSLGLSITICGTDGACSFEQMLESARGYVPFLPEERFFPKGSDLFEGYYDYEIFAYCEAKAVQISTTDLTADTTTDCRKVIYQYTGTSGDSLTDKPDESAECYKDETYDYTFKQWCEAQFSQNDYWVEGQLEEYCDPPEKVVNEEEYSNNEGECLITTEILDVKYYTDESTEVVDKNIVKVIRVKDCEGNIISEEYFTTNTDFDKSEILGDGTTESSCVVGVNCPNTSGTGEGTGSGIGEGAGSGGSGSSSGYTRPFGDTSSWWESTYNNDFGTVINKHLDTLQNGEMGAFLNSLNPFSEGGNFPNFELDFDFGVVDFGQYSFDPTAIPISDTRTINIIALIKALLLIAASFYAFRQVL